MTTHHFEATCQRDGRVWLVSVPAMLAYTTTANLSTAEERIRDALALILQAPPEEIAVSVTIDHPSLAELTEARKALSIAWQREHQALVDAVHDLLSQDVRRSDIAHMTGISTAEVKRIAQ